MSCDGGSCRIVDDQQLGSFATRVDRRKAPINA